MTRCQHISRCRAHLWGAVDSVAWASEHAAEVGEHAIVASLRAAEADLARHIATLTVLRTRQEVADGCRTA